MVLRIPKTEADIEVFVEHAMTKYGISQQITGGFINYDDVAGVETIKKVRKSEILVDPIKNPKIVELIRIANENPDKLIVVWAKYRTEILMIKQALELTYGRGVCSEYHGGIPKEERDNEERRFLNKESRFMLSNQQTGGAGTTWTESEITFYYSNGFRMLDREQSEDRNHRIGTVNKVMYYDMLAEDTIDEQILDAIELKKDLAKFVRDGIRARLLTSE
jgi:SNF2 family DNA or RNA helicase